MRTESLPPIYARLGEREVPITWAWYRPEPQVGDTVRIPTAPGGNDGWKSFRVVGKRLRTASAEDEASANAVAQMSRQIDLDVEPLARQE